MMSEHLKLLEPSRRRRLELLELLELFELSQLSTFRVLNYYENNVPLSHGIARHRPNAQKECRNFVVS